MFKFLFYLGVLATAVQSIQAEGNPEITKLERFYYDKCLKNTGNTAAFDKLRTDTYETNKYFEYAFQFLPDQRQTFCTNERTNLIHRIKEIENDLKPCLSPSEKYLAGFLKESFTELLHFFCHNNGVYAKRFFSSEGAQCRQRIENANSNDLDNCLNRIFSPTRSFITKNEMCDDITVARKCFTQLLDVYCPNSQDFKRLNQIFFDYIGKPCGSCIHLISSFAIVGSVLLHFLINKF